MANREEERYDEDIVPAEPEDVTKISDDVLSTIAGIELAKIEGVNPAGGGITDFLGRKGPSKGITIEASGDNIAVEVVVIVDYGISIPDVAHEIQTRLRKAITEITGRFVSAVNVNVQGIRTGVEKRENADENKSYSDKEEE